MTLEKKEYLKGLLDRATLIPDSNMAIWQVGEVIKEVIDDLEQDRA